MSILYILVNTSHCFSYAPRNNYKAISAAFTAAEQLKYGTILIPVRVPWSST